jgi:hypothetical protein
MTMARKLSPDEAKDLVLGVYREVLKNPGIEGGDDFFQAGGDSAKGVEVIHRIRDLTGVRLTMSTMYMNPSAEELSEEIAPGPAE